MYQIHIYIYVFIYVNIYKVALQKKQTNKQINTRAVRASGHCACQRLFADTAQTRKSKADVIKQLVCIGNACACKKRDQREGGRVGAERAETCQAREPVELDHWICTK